MRKTIFLSTVFLLVATSFTTGCGASAPPAAAAYPSVSAPAGAPLAEPAPAKLSAEDATMSAAPAQPSTPGAMSHAGGIPRPATHVNASSAAASPATAPASGSAKNELQGAKGGASAQKSKEGATDAVASLGVIYTGTVSMRAKREEYAKTIDRVVDLAESLGGAITARTDDSVEVRVPSASFRKAMSGMEEVGVVENRGVTAQDVSEEMHDLDVRLQNMRATRKRLEEFLAKATNIADTLTVERELERVAVEIDRIEGRLAFLRAHTSFSQITVRLIEKPKDALPVVVPPPPPPPPPPPRKLLDAPASWIDQVGIDPLLKVHS